MKQATYSISIGIVVIGLAGVAATGCGDSGGSRSAMPDGGASDAAASLGGQAGATSATGGTAGTPGTGGEAGTKGAGGAAGSQNTGGEAGTKGAGGAAGSQNTGGEAGTKGAGGAAGSGGTIGSGGTKKALDGGADAAVDVLMSEAGGTVDGAADAGGKDGSASDPRAVPDSSVAPDGEMVCGPVCLVYCPYGNELDENGCATCTCNAPPPCPAIKCQSCATGYLRDTNGCLTCTCAPDPSAPCDQLLDLRLCGASTHCRWLAPGCAMGGTPLADSESGCYEQVDCTATSNCSKVGSACVEHLVDPDPYSSGGDWCGMTVHICL